MHLEKFGCPLRERCQYLAELPRLGVSGVERHSEVLELVHDAFDAAGSEP